MKLLASMEPFLELVVRSGLLTPEQVAPCVTSSGRVPVDRDLIASHLVGNGLLTTYQARLLLNGWYRGFFIAEKYKILELLGEGGMGRVYLCEQLVLQRLVAIKQLQVESEAIPGAAERFLREAMAVAALDHPNIARIHDADRCVDGAFLVMEAVDGINLHQLTARHGRVSVGRAAGLIQQAALGLHHAYERGLVHRDIKPGNLMVDRSGTVKILDMGLARFFDSRRNHDLTGRFDLRRALGTAEFMSPEQAINSSDVDTRADIYSLGGTLYFLLLGRFPYETGTAFEKLYRHQTEPFDPIGPQRPEVPEGLIAVLDQMVAKRPADRFAHPAAVAKALAPYATSPEPLTASEHPPASNYRLGLNETFKANPSTAVLISATTPPRGTSYHSTTVFDSSHRALPTESDASTSAPTAVVPNVGDAITPHMLRRPIVARRPRMGLLTWFVFVGLVLLAAGFGVWFGQRMEHPLLANSAAPVEIELTGAGSTLAQPLFEIWAKPGVSYRSIGSARGVRQMVEQVVDFAVSDVPLTDPQVHGAEQVNGAVRHIPVALSAVAVSHNVPGVTEPLQFTGPVIADIYLGKITHWDDVALKADNPGTQLPSLPITVVRRSDGSGTSALFTSYLSEVSYQWATKIGTSTEPKWLMPTNGPAKVINAKGNSEVADVITRTAGAIGYLDATHALSVGLPLDKLRNSEGRYVAPTLAGMVAAVKNCKSPIPDDLRFSLTNAPGEASYPIVGAVWVITYERPPAAKVPRLKTYLQGILERGPGPLESIGYGALPAELRQKSLAAVDAITAKE